MASGHRFEEHSECPSAQKGGAMCGDLGPWAKTQIRPLGSNWDMHGTFRGISPTILGNIYIYTYIVYGIYIYIHIYNTYHIPNWGRSWKAIENHCVQRSCSTKFHGFWTEHLREPLFFRCKSHSVGFRCSSHPLRNDVTFDGYGWG